MNDTLRFRFAFEYSFSPHNIRLNLSTISAFRGKYIKIGTVKDLIVIESLPESGVVDPGPRIEMTSQSIENIIFFHLTGSYTDRNKSKKMSIDGFYSYDIQKAITGVPSSEILKELRGL